MQYALVNCPFIEPVIFKIGPLASTWYGLMYSTGAVLWYLVTRGEIIRRGGPIPVGALPELLFYGLVGGLVGARIGYAVFYSPFSFLERPWDIIALWHGGMSAHGWLAGMSAGGIFFVWKRQVDLRKLSDTIYLGLPIGLGAVKIGNFINCEGYGKMTSVPWGVVFSRVGPEPRHPSQLYEAIFEGFLMFALLYWARTKRLESGDLSCFFLAGYGTMRFLIEFTCQTSPVWGGKLGWLSSGQVLSVVVFIVAVIGYIIPRGHAIARKFVI